MRRLPSCTDPQVQALLSVLGDISFLLSQGDLAFSFFSHVAGSISTVRFGPQCVCVCVCPTLCNPMDYSPHQTPLSMEFSRQEYWSGLPFPSPGDLPDPGMETRSLSLQADSLPSEPPGKPSMQMLGMNKICMSHVTSV